MLPPNGEEGRVEIVLDHRADAAHPQRVLGRLLDDYVDHVVVRDDADQPLGRVDDGNRQKVIAGHGLGHVLAVGVDGHRNHVLLHDRVDPRGRPGQNQVVQRNETGQVPLGIDHVNVINRLGRRRLQPQLGNRVAHREVAGQRGIFGRHHRAGTVLRIAQERADVLAIGLGDQRQQALHDLRVEPLEQIDPLVVGHRFDQARHSHPALGRRHFHLLANGEEAENFRLPVNSRMLEDFPGLLDGEPFGPVGDRGRVQLGHQRREPLPVVLGQHRPQLGQQQHARHVLGLSLRPVSVLPGPAKKIARSAPTEADR